MWEKETRSQDERCGFGEATVKRGKMGQFSTSAMYFNMIYMFLKSTKNTVTSSYIVVAISTGNTIKIGYKIFFKK